MHMVDIKIKAKPPSPKGQIYAAPMYRLASPRVTGEQFVRSKQLGMQADAKYSHYGKVIWRTRSSEGHLELTMRARLGAVVRLHQSCEVAGG